MPILHSFKENKLEYEDEDEVKIMMMGTGMDKESLEHNLYEDDITLIICHNFSPTLNPPIKPKDSGNFRMKRNSDEKEEKVSPNKLYLVTGANIWKAFGGNTRDLGSFGEETDKTTDLHQNLLKIMLTKRGDSVTTIKRHRHDLRSDIVSTLVTPSEHGRPKETLEDSVSRE
ncbi:hypothetical protein Tco_1190915 [Tanacetum coccineum]